MQSARHRVIIIVLLIITYGGAIAPLLGGLHVYDNISMVHCQGGVRDSPPADAVSLTDVGRCGRERPWAVYKVANDYLAVAYDSVDKRKAARLRECCNALVFDADGTGAKRLVSASSCRVRLCPLCTWRRSLKAYYNTMRVVDFINQHSPTTSYIFVTLTIRNCIGAALSETLDTLYAGLQRLCQRKDIRAVWRGSVRNLEVTHNVNRDSKDYDTYHPHIHMLVAVNKSYYHDRRYISRAKLAALWRDCLRVDYMPQVDIRACKGTDARAVAECSKYATKYSDYLIMDDWDLTIDTVRTLDQALANRRLIGYTGIMRDAKARLALDDVEDGDLVNVGDGVEIVDDVGKHREVYWWYSGYRQYYKID